MSAAARRESRARERHVPPVSTYRWWARRTEAVTGGVLDAVAADAPDPRLLVVDPFAGGGTVALSATVRGHRVYAQDINPWAAAGLATMLSLPPREALLEAADALHESCRSLLERAYATRSTTGEPAAVAHTIRVAAGRCPECDARWRLYPYALVSRRQRVDTLASGDDAWLACAYGHLFAGRASAPSTCPVCRLRVSPEDRYTAARVFRCPCGAAAPLRDVAANGLEWDPVLVERVAESRRDLSPPTAAEIAQATEGWAPDRDLGAIPVGVETRALHSFGYRRWQDCYPPRQQVVLEGVLRAVEELSAAEEVRAALRLAVLGSTEMAGYLSRWERRYLKAYEAVSSHRFSLTTLACEPHVWGVGPVGRGTVRRRVDALARSAEWLRAHAGELTVDGPRSAQQRRGRMPARVDVRVTRGSSHRMLLPAHSADVIWTDPPYHDDVHYGELSGLFRAWDGTGELLADEAVATALDDVDYQRLLTWVFVECRRVLKPGGHLLLSYANREPRAWAALFAALSAAGFRACGYEVVHAENDADHGKRGVRACTMDAVLDLVPAAAGTPAAPHRPQRCCGDAQERFLLRVGEWFLAAVDPAAGAWWEPMVAQLCAEPFLAPHPPG
ncbi:hypothetical protein ER308_08725 [Egibacter rhizosphaerae]|uniref:DNA methylase n=1 Tax=Egibacter rhizosphaerae TaxID=1670831 RepID=A0A411YEK2_9ACTN|nr:hypothetical protein [Egibacter rhizosphaerae]QBI19626.1 hypothetical protein ER308_08725 [Egibacter rhizosphaerae]